MVRISFVILLLLGMGAPFSADAGDEATALAPEKGFVYVQTSFVGGVRAPNIGISIQKLSGNYPVPPGPYATDAFGKIWVALYPGVYRFRARARGASPSYIDVTVASRSESYIFFTVPASRKLSVTAPEPAVLVGGG